MLNAAIDVAVAGREGVGVLDLHRMPGGYDPAWSVDRLHPSELGHRLLARRGGDLGPVMLRSFAGGLRAGRR